VPLCRCFPGAGRCLITRPFCLFVDLMYLTLPTRQCCFRIAAFAGTSFVVESARTERWRWPRPAIAPAHPRRRRMGTKRTTIVPDPTACAGAATAAGTTTTRIALRALLPIPVRIDAAPSPQTDCPEAAPDRPPVARVSGRLRSPPHKRVSLLGETRSTLDPGIDGGGGAEDAPPAGLGAARHELRWPCAYRG
jgi:hypothetical protein